MESSNKFLYKIVLLRGKKVLNCLKDLAYAPHRSDKGIATTKVFRVETIALQYRFMGQSPHCLDDFKCNIPVCQGRRELNPCSRTLTQAVQVSSTHRTGLLLSPAWVLLGNSSRKIKCCQTMQSAKCIMKSMWGALGAFMTKHLRRCPCSATSIQVM